MTYQPFLIAPFATGLDTDQEPWLLPQDAFSELSNAHIHHGVIEKRNGYRPLAKIPHCISITGATNADPAVFTVAATTGISEGDTVQLNHMTGGTWNTLNKVQYTAVNVTGTTFELQLSGVDVSGVGLGTFTSGCVGYYPGERVMGLWRHIAADNTKTLIAFDTKRAAIYDATVELFTPLDTADIFNSAVSADTSYVTATNWASIASTNSAATFRMYFTNGKSKGAGTTDGIRVYDPAISTTTTGLFNPTINSATEIRGAKFIFAIKQRLLLLYTFEGSNTYPQRARWSQVQNPGGTGASYPLSFSTEWDDNSPGKGGFVDAPTSQSIISAQQLHDQIIVFFTSSVWTLRPTADPALPFRWDKLNDFRSCGAKMASVEMDGQVIALGNRGITATNGVDTQRIDERIQHFVTNEIDADNFDKVFSKRSFNDQKIWNLYPTGSDSDITKALIIDRDSGAFSTYDITMNVLGYTNIGIDYALDDFPATEDPENKLPVYIGGDSDYAAGGETLQDYHWNLNAEIFVGGDTNGEVFQLEFGSNDDGAQIGMELFSAAWNPWIQEGAQAQLGYIDVFMDSHRHAEFGYEFFKDTADSPYLIKIGDALPNLSEVAPIQAISNANPGNVRAGSHGLVTGDVIYIYKVRGMETINGQALTVTVVDQDNFTVGVDTSAYGTYISNGVITRRPYEEGKVWKRIYVGGTGYQHRLRLTNSGIDEPVRIHAIMLYMKRIGGRLL